MNFSNYNQRNPEIVFYPFPRLVDYTQYGEQITQVYKSKNVLMVYKHKRILVSLANL